MNLLILAAGRGSRLPKKFRNYPKCLTKISGKTIFQFNYDFFMKFNQRFIISGYKSKLMKNKINTKLFKFIQNKKFRSTNMVHSMFLASNKITNDVVVCYGDVIFDKKIYKIFEKKKNIIPLYKSWLSLWKKRMSFNKIKNDAEDLRIKNNKLVMIGEKIINKFPKYQYMGIFKLNKKDYFKLKDYYLSLNNKKIDMTNFINSALQNKIIEFNVKIYNKLWFEIDTSQDVKVASKFFN